MKEENESHSPNPEETDENVQYIIVNPRSLSDDESGSNKKRPRWEYWETKTLIDIMKEQNDVSVSDKSKARTKDNFFLLEQEMRKRGVERWDSSQIQQKWRNLRKDWANMRTSNYRNGVSKITSEFQGEMDELLGTPPSNCSLSGVDSTSGDEIIGYEVETLEPADHVTVVIDNGDKRSRASPSSHSDQKCRLESKHNAKPSTSSEDGQDMDSIHDPVKGKKLKKKDTSTQSKKDLFIWPHSGVLLLLKIYKKMEHEFSSGKRRHNKIWDDIAKAIRSINSDLNVTGCQCQQKISGLKRTYSSIKENRPLTGNDKISWPYYPIVDKIFGDKPYLRYSLGSKMSRKDCGVPLKIKHSSTSSSSDEGNAPGTSSTKRTRVNSVLEQYIQDMKKQRELLRLKRERKAEEKERRKEEIEKRKMEQRRKMHEEKITMQRAALDILKQILSKNK